MCCERTDCCSDDHPDDSACDRTDAAYGARESVPRTAHPHRRNREADAALIEDYTSRVEEGVTLTAYTLEFTAWIQHCFDCLEAGQEDRILSDPFFNSGISDEQVDAVITALDAEYEHELGTYPGYHRNRSGCNALPEFHRLSARGRRALVEGCLRIKRKYGAR